MFKHIFQDINHLYEIICIYQDIEIYILKALLCYTNSKYLEIVFKNKWILNYFQIVKLVRHWILHFEIGLNSTFQKIYNSIDVFFIFLLPMA